MSIFLPKKAIRFGNPTLAILQPQTNWLTGHTPRWAASEVTMATEWNSRTLLPGDQKLGCTCSPCLQRALKEERKGNYLMHTHPLNAQAIWRRGHWPNSPLPPGKWTHFDHLGLLAQSSSFPEDEPWGYATLGRTRPAEKSYTSLLCVNVVVFPHLSAYQNMCQLVTECVYMCVFTDRCVCVCVWRHTHTHMPNKPCAVQSLQGTKC